MPDKKLTDNEIKKALEVWIKNYDGLYVNFKTLGNALDLINRLQAKVEGLELELADTKRDLRIVLDNSISAKLPHCVLCGKGAILTKSLEDYDELIGDISAEAYKECIEKVKEEYADLMEFGYADISVDGLFKNLDNLLKELVGEK